MNKNTEILNIVNEVLNEWELGLPHEEYSIAIDMINERLVKLFAIPVVIDTVCCENCVNFYPDTKTCDNTCIEYSKFKQQTGL